MSDALAKPQYRTGVAAGLAGAIMCIVAYGLSFAHIVLPADVIDAATFLLTFGAGWFVHSSNVEQAPQNPTNPT